LLNSVFFWHLMSNFLQGDFTAGLLTVFVTGGGFVGVGVVGALLAGDAALAVVVVVGAPLGAAGPSLPLGAALDAGAAVGRSLDAGAAVAVAVVVAADAGAAATTGEPEPDPPTDALSVDAPRPREKKRIAAIARIDRPTTRPATITWRSRLRFEARGEARW